MSQRQIKSGFQKEKKGKTKGRQYVTQFFNIEGKLLAAIHTESVVPAPGHQDQQKHLHQLYSQLKKQVQKWGIWTVAEQPGSHRLATPENNSMPPCGATLLH